jgi:DNA recombination protein RmuC
VLDKVHKQLLTASNSIEAAGQRTRVIERRLRSVEALPVPDAAELLAADTGDDDPQAPSG